MLCLGQTRKLRSPFHNLLSVMKKCLKLEMAISVQRNKQLFPILYFVDGKLEKTKKYNCKGIEPFPMQRERCVLCAVLLNTGKHREP